MCGIVGILSSENKELELDVMLQQQKHRGPDFTGKYMDKNCAYLGHNRLSIIDLSNQANQPFSDPEGRYYLTFNGEIYNYLELKQDLRSKYTFITQSDTEVLLAAYIFYGKAMLNKLNGMFSFAIWDSMKKELFAARDRFGVKPFYYFEEGNNFYFASEIKSLRSIKKDFQLSSKVWSNYFSQGSYGLPHESFYEDIFQLPAGHQLEYKSGKLIINRWYDFQQRVTEQEKIFDEATVKERYLELLKDSISLRFRADVEVGFNLSGGLDSSLLLALVNEFSENDKIQAFTFYTGNKGYDEMYWAEKMVSQTNNPHTKIKLSSEAVIDLSEKFSELQDEPFGGIPTLAYSAIFKNASSRGIKVLLDGQGMDEQWAGYDYYANLKNSTIQGQKNVNTTFKPQCLNPEFGRESEKIDYPEPFESRIKNLQYRDLFFTKLPRALRFNDRISMAYSTELREPFLDYRLVELAFSLPDHFKIRNRTHKYLLREIIQDYLPYEISYAPKRALQTPQREWLGDNLQDWVEKRIQILLDGEKANWFDKDSLMNEWKRYKNGDRSSSFHIWQWINSSFIL